ncbi:hypothetical protein FSP39_007067 [Pinctada imbricata]|uniref:G-protein coupled receptors family 1 profile domain-containing protein n=1 Tax=Pinctada imbricata TaxID=66713 RepID=A0AA89BSF3_PINIB|nr:hypothetical protein FSP39_007067 [Pinctada imbricata]
MDDMDLRNLSQIMDVFQRLPSASKDNLTRRCVNCTLEQLINYINGFYSEIDTDENDSVDNYQEYIIGKKLLLYISPIILIIGTIGNLLSFIVFKAHGSKVSTYSYLAALAVMDLFVLYVGLLRRWVAQLSDIDIGDHSDWLCKFVMFFGYVCSDSSVWLIIIVTAERYIAVQYPLRASIMCKVRRARFITFIPVIVLCIINIHFFWTVALNPFNGQIKCSANPSYIFLVEKVWPWVDTALYSLCPFFIITILNSFIVHQVLNARRKREAYLMQKKERAIPHRRSKSAEASMRLTLMLLAVSFSFLITTLPMNVVLIVSQFGNNSPKQGMKQYASFILVKDISEILMYVNHSINFFLYCAAGKKFRKILMDILCNKCHRCAEKAEESQTIMRTRYAIKLARYGSEKSSDYHSNNARVIL